MKGLTIITKASEIEENVVYPSPSIEFSCLDHRPIGCSASYLRKTNNRTDKHTGRYTDKRINQQTDRYEDRQINRQTDKQKQTDEQTDK